MWSVVRQEEAVCTTLQEEVMQSDLSHSITPFAHLSLISDDFVGYRLVVSVDNFNLEILKSY